MIDHVVSDLIERTKSRLEELEPSSIDDIRNAQAEIVGFSDEVRQKHVSLKRFLNKQLYQHEKVQSMTRQARAMIERLFDRYMSDPEQMSREFADRASREEKPRVVSDYIAGMTDRFAIAEHERLEQGAATRFP
jgi:dGTPase